MNPAVRALRRIATDRRPLPAAGERCEMCAESIADEHQHVVDVQARQLMCVCRGCYLLFTDRDAALRYRAVPDRYISFPDFALTLPEWDALEIPVGLAFFFRNSAADRTVALYPGPAGATESELPLSDWQAFVDNHHEFADLADDVEALLIRVPDRDAAGAQCLLLPIDACYEFVGRIRLQWHGFDGGSEVRRYIEEFFAAVSARARPRDARSGHTVPPSGTTRRSDTLGASDAAGQGDVAWPGDTAGSVDGVRASGVAGPCDAGGSGDAAGQGVTASGGAP